MKQKIEGGENTTLKNKQLRNRIREILDGVEKSDLILNEIMFEIRKSHSIIYGLKIKKQIEDLLVNSRRGSVKQESECGLYHWNDCVDWLLKELKNL